MNLNTWRRTAFEDASGSFEVAPDDWTLLDPSGKPLARIYKVAGGPQDGRCTGPFYSGRMAAWDPVELDLWRLGARRGKLVRRGYRNR